MATAEIKTEATGQSVTYYLACLEPDRKREDAMAINAMMRRVTGEVPKMWNNSIIGFGKTHYRYDTGRDDEWFLVGFAPRKANLVLYVMPQFKQCDALLKKLGKHRKGKSCFYINKLADVDTDVLEKIVTLSVAHMRDVAAAA